MVKIVRKKMVNIIIKDRHEVTMQAKKGVRMSMLELNTTPTWSHHRCLQKSFVYDYIYNYIERE